MELGGPEVGRGCGGRGIIHGFELLEKLGFHDWGFDYVLLDFLGDVVCGGFGLPIARDMCQKVIVVGVERSAVALRRQQRLLGGGLFPQDRRQRRRRRHGHQQGRRHRRGRRPSPQSVGIPVLAAIPADDDIRRKSANYEIIGRPGGRWAPLFEELAQQVADAPPVRPTPLTHDTLLGLFKGDAVGRDVVLEPATLEDMCGSDGPREAVARSDLRGRLRWTAR